MIVNSIFSFLRGRTPIPDDEPPTEPASAASASAPSFSVAGAAMITTSGPPALDDVLAQMLSVLEGYFPADAGPALVTGVSVVSVAERTLGLGNRRGDEARAGFAVVALKGGRLEATVRFQALANNAGDVETAIDTLHATLLANKDPLWAAGFLRLSAEDTSPADLIAPPDTWRKTTDYKLLYEFHYQDTDEARSLIARIPIASDPEVRNSLQREMTVVTDEMVRWDDEDLPARLVVRELARVSSLNALIFVPGAVPEGRVTLRRTFDGASGPPQLYPNLAEFLANAGGSTPSERHGQVTFDPFSDFLAAFTPVGSSIMLGDWDEDDTPDNYEPGILTFEPAIYLPGPTDHLDIVYQNGGDGLFGHVAVLYLQAK